MNSSDTKKSSGKRSAAERFANVEEATGILAEVISQAVAANPGKDVILAKDAPEVGAAFVTQLELDRIKSESN